MNWVVNTVARIFIGSSAFRRLDTTAALKPSPCRRLLGALLALSFVLSVHAQGPLSNGARSAGELAPVGETDSWTFAAKAGEGIMIRVGATNFTPKIELFGPNNAPLTNVVAGNTFSRDGVVKIAAPADGNYTILVSAAFANQSGPYGITAAAALETIVVSPGDEGGALTNGTLNTGTIALGDLDVWSFTAAAGDGLMLRMGSPDLTPWIRLYGPSGALISETTSGNTFARDGFVSLTATNAGVYTVMVGAVYSGQFGPYQLTLAQAPTTFVVSNGDEGGTAVNGALNVGTITVGDLDLWRFDAPAGAGLYIRMGSPDFTPWLRLYGPNGAFITEETSGNTFARDGVLTLVATNAGSYTLVASATYSGQSGSYRLTVAQAPTSFVVSGGDEGGALTNGFLHTGTIAVGDADVWNFSAQSGDGLQLRMGSPDFTPWLRVYGPTGGLVAATTSGNTFARDGVVTLSATNSGTYTVISSATYAGQSGDYRLTLAQAPGEFAVSPGDEGGSLTNGVTSAGQITVGDIDLWSFSAEAGSGVIVRMGSPDFTPWLRVYGPDGRLAEETTSGNTFARDGAVTFSATNSGIYTVAVAATFSGQSGAYSLTQVQALAPITIAAGDDGGALVNAATNIAKIAVGDIDVWSFYGTPGDSNVLRVVSTNFTPWLRLYGPTGALVSETTSGNTFAREGALRLNITNAGTYTIAISATFSGQTGDYAFKQSRVPPDLIVPETQTIDEQTPLQVTLSAQDPDVPAKPLTFALLSAPPGMTLTLTGATNATLNWSTTEADGPSTNRVVATVTDTVNGRAFIRTNSFTVIVREINLVPQLTVPNAQTLDEGTPLSVSASVTDADLPVNGQTFSLQDAPQGMAIDPATGLITWTPTEAQGPTVATVKVIVTDDNPPAANSPHLSATNTVTVTVREVNLPPQLTLPPPQTVDELQPLNVVATVVDPDLPANTPTFSLVSAPAGMAINPATGAITWVPTEAQGPITNIVTVKVEDNGVPTLNATASFTVTVRDVNSPPVLPESGTREINEGTPLSIVNTATDTDLPANQLSYQLVSPPAGASISPSGVISWAPTEADGPSTNTLTTVVTDDGTPRLSATNVFTVIVREVNSAPALPESGIREVDEGSPLNIVNTATDADLPANQLSYQLISPPAGASISPAGVISWTPMEADGPSTNILTTVVTDDGTPRLSATNRFTVIVREVNTAPELKAIANQSLHFGTPLTLQAEASDADLPANPLSYQLENAPTGLSVDAAKGTLTWTPTEAQVGTHTVTLRVSDNGTPALNSAVTFMITVTGAGSTLALDRLNSGLVRLTISGDAGHDYELEGSSDLNQWTKLVQFRLTTAPFTFIDPDSATLSIRFYRLRFSQ